MIRKPDVVIGEGYLQRWYLVPRNRFFNVYLHRFTGSDDDRALHDHPWHSVSFLVRGALREIRAVKLNGLTVHATRAVPRILPVFRRATLAHRLELVAGPAWTIFITGPKIREWGFRCPHGWRHWMDFTDETGHHIGRGCE